MTDMSRFKPASTHDLHRGDTVFLQARKGSDVLKASFLSGGGDDEYEFSAALDGSSTGFPFKIAEWHVFVERQFPLPDQTDVENLLYNVKAQGESQGIPVTYSMLAEQVIRLIKGEIKTPVKMFEPDVVIQDEVAEDRLTEPGDD